LALTAHGAAAVDVAGAAERAEALVEARHVGAEGPRLAEEVVRAEQAVPRSAAVAPDWAERDLAGRADQAVQLAAADSAAVCRRAAEVAGPGAPLG
jgi:hypothetical protein